MLPGRAEHKQRLAALGVEKDVANTLSDIGIWADAYKRRTGRWGIDEEAYGWLQNHLGRQIVPHWEAAVLSGSLKQQWNIRVFRSKGDRRSDRVARRKNAVPRRWTSERDNGISAEADGFLGFSRNVVQGGKEYVEGTVLSPLGRCPASVVRLKKRDMGGMCDTGNLGLEIRSRRPWLFRGAVPCPPVGMRRIHREAQTCYPCICAA